MLPFDYHTLLLYLHFLYFLIFFPSAPRALYRVNLALYKSYKLLIPPYNVLQMCHTTFNANLIGIMSHLHRRRYPCTVSEDPCEACRLSRRQQRGQSFVLRPRSSTSAPWSGRPSHPWRGRRGAWWGGGEGRCPSRTQHAVPEVSLPLEDLLKISYKLVYFGSSGTNIIQVK